MKTFVNIFIALCSISTIFALVRIVQIKRKIHRLQDGLKESHSSSFKFSEETFPKNPDLARVMPNWTREVHEEYPLAA